MLRLKTALIMAIITLTGCSGGSVHLAPDPSVWRSTATSAEKSQCISNLMPRSRARRIVFSVADNSQDFNFTSLGIERTAATQYILALARNADGIAVVDSTLRQNSYLVDVSDEGAAGSSSRYIDPDYVVYVKSSLSESVGGHGGRLSADGSNVSGFVNLSQDTSYAVIDVYIVDYRTSEIIPRSSVTRSLKLERKEFQFLLGLGGVTGAPSVSINTQQQANVIVSLRETINGALASSLGNLMQVPYWRCEVM